MERQAQKDIKRGFTIKLRERVIFVNSFLFTENFGDFLNRGWARMARISDSMVGPEYGRGYERTTLSQDFNVNSYLGQESGKNPVKRGDDIC